MNKYFSDFAGISEMDLAGKYCYEQLGNMYMTLPKPGMQKSAVFARKIHVLIIKKLLLLKDLLKINVIRVTTIPELDVNGEITTFMEVVEDITDRKLAETEAIRAGHLAISWRAGGRRGP